MWDLEPKKLKYYFRRCRRCLRTYKSHARRGKYCPDCCKPYKNGKKP